MAENGLSSADEAAGGEGANPLLRLSLRTKALVISSEYTHRQMSPEELREVLAALAPTSDEQREVVSSVEEELRAARYPVGEIMRLIGELAPQEEDDSAEDAPAGGIEAGETETGETDDAEEAAEDDATGGDEAAGEAEEAGGPAEPPSPVDPHVGVTRKVRSPHLMPFEKFEFESSPHSSSAPAGATPGAVDPHAPAPPTREMPAAGKDVRAGAPAETGTEKPPAPAEGAASGFKFSAGGETATGPWRRDRGASTRGRSRGDLRGAETSRFNPKGFGDLAHAASAPSEVKPSILVADDDMGARMIYRAKLEERGFDVAEARDGLEAWNRIRAGGIQCVVLDMKMPGYHGLEVLGRMTEADIALPVVVVSAFNQLANEFVVATYPRLTFLTKPASPKQVADAVVEFVGAPPGAG